MSNTMPDSTTTEMQERVEVGLPPAPVPLPSGRASTPNTRPDADVRELTPAEWWHEWNRGSYHEDGRYHLSGIKESAGIGSRDTRVTLEQLKALHRSLGRIVNGLDKPASHGPMLAMLVNGRSVAGVAADAGVDADALQRHLDGEGPLSRIA